MRGNKHTDFLKSIRLPGEKKVKKSGKSQGTQSDRTYKMARQEEIDLQKKLERRFDELFWTTEED